MEKTIADLFAYFSTSGSFADAVVFSQLVAKAALSEIAQLCHIVQGTI